MCIALLFASSYAKKCAQSASLCVCMRACVCELDRCTSVSACCFDIFHIGSSDMNGCFDPIRIRQHHPGSFAAALNTQPERHTETEKEEDSYCFPIALVAMDQRSFHVQRSYLLKDVLWLFCQQINKKIDLSIFRHCLCFGNILKESESINL